MVTVLAIDTATASVGCALWSDGAPLASFTLVAPQRHAEVLMTAIDGLCRGAGLAAADLGGVVVDIGPGLFTGLRVGLATARAIATARGLLVAGVTSLEALAYPHRRGAGLVVPVVDARRGEVYSAIYTGQRGTLAMVRPPAVTSPDDLATELARGRGGALVVGDGAWRYRQVLAASGAEVAGPADMAPSPSVLAELGGGRLGRSFPQPLYLRQADVRIGWDQAGGRVGALVRPGPVPAATMPSARPRLGS